jgi:hydrogenase/urease accessory protein HupE
LVVLVAIGMGFANIGLAHEFKPGLLALIERTAGVYDVTWRLPLEDAAYPLRPLFPPGTTRHPGGTRGREMDALVERFSIERAGGLERQTIRLAGSAPGLNEILVRIEARGGHVVTGQMSTKRPAFTVPAVPAQSAIAWLYFGLGVEHILSGLDHLAFVFLLVLLASGVAAIVRAVTAFTVAHSLTLALAALGMVHVPQAPVEATIALSILLLARQLVVRDHHRDHSAAAGAVSAAPWLSAFGFGLLHGLGFAGALSGVGLPAGDIPLALFCFNVGVEAGQLAFVVVILLIRRAFAPWIQAAVRGHWARFVTALSSVPVRAVGVLAGFWLIERIAAFFV